MKINLFDKFIRLMWLIIVAFALISVVAQAEDGFDPFRTVGNDNVVNTDNDAIGDDESPKIPEFNFQNDDISMAFQLISDVTGWSIFPSNNVSKSKITLWAKNITARELLDKVVAISGFLYYQDGDVVTVLTYDEYLQNYGLVQKVLPMKYADANSVSAVIKPFQSKLGKIVVHTETNTIVLYETEANLKYLTSVVEKLDSPSEERVVVIVELKYITAESLAQTLEGIFDSKESSKKNRSSEKTIGGKTSKKGVSGSEGSEKGVSGSEGSEKGVSSSGGSEIVVSGSGGSEIVVSGDVLSIFAAPDSNRLIIVGCKKDIDEVKKIISFVDVAGEKTLTEIIEFKYAKAELLADILDQVFAGRGKNTKIDKKGQSIESSQKRDIGLYLVPDSNRLVVVGTQEEIDEVREFIGLVDIASEKTLIEIIDLEYADPKMLAEILGRVFSDREETSTNKTVKVNNSSNSSQSRDIELYAVPDSNRLIVVGIQSDIDEVKELIALVDIPGEEMLIDIMDLKYVSAETLANTLGQIFSVRSDKTGNKAGDGQTGSYRRGVSFYSLPECNRLILVGFQKEIEDARKFIVEIDIDSGVSLLEIVELEYSDAEILAQTLREIFAVKEEGVASKPTDASRKVNGLDVGDFMAETSGTLDFFAVGRTNRLVIKGLKRDVERVIEFVRKLDIFADSTTKSYHVAYVDAAEVMSSLQQVLGVGGSNWSPNQSGNRPGGQSGMGSRSRMQSSVTLTLLEDNNSILLTGPPSAHRIAMSILETVDVQGEYEAGIIKIYKLENSNLEEVVSVIKDLIGEDADESIDNNDQTKFSSRSTEAEGSNINEGKSKTDEYSRKIKTRVSINKSTNSIIVQATANRHREFAKLIGELDERKMQVMIKAMIVEVITTDDMDFGVEINHAAKDAVLFTDFGLSDLDAITGVRDILVSSGGTAAVLRPDKVQAIIHAIKSNSNMRIKSAPEILVNDNAVGIISSESEEPTKVANQGETTTSTSFGGYIKAGTVFTITPHISEKNYLRVEYQISLASFGEKDDADLPPPKSTNQIESEATVPDGATIVVGGLQMSKEVENVDRVPLLGDIPILNVFFKNTVIRKQYRTTYLFITPTIMPSDNFDDLKAVSESWLNEVEKISK